MLCKENWTEHNPSCTVSYGPDELADIVEWVWQHRHAIGGLSFLPRYEARYEQMPYEEVSAEEYQRRAAVFPPIDFGRIYAYELDDMTTATTEIACAAEGCEV